LIGKKEGSVKKLFRLSRKGRIVDRTKKGKMHRGKNVKNVHSPLLLREHDKGIPNRRGEDVKKRLNYLGNHKNAYR